MIKRSHNRFGVVLLLCILLYGQLVTAQKIANVSFKRHTLTSDFVSEGVAVGDVNHDGKTDVMAGAYWFQAPGWTKHEIAKPDTFSATKGYSNSFLNFSLDVNRDGWIDLIRIGLPGRETVWYENPGKNTGHWKMHFVYANTGNEAPVFVDVDGDGRKDLICANAVKKKMVWLRAPVSKADTAWSEFPFSTDTVLSVYKPTIHGLGFEDMNNDGRKDILIKEGWWEMPKDPKQPGWVFHPADFGEDCAEMYTMDVDRDGDLDVLTSSAHNYGVWWHEQVKDANGNITWKHHVIDKSFSESHGLALADINRDGYPDLITGKRYLAHIKGDPGDMEPSVLYWFEYKPGTEPTWIRHQLDDDTGVGLHLLAEDITKDKRIDIIVSNKKGVYVYEQLKK